MRSEIIVGAVAALVGGASAHGNITSPPARLPGPAMQAACGAQAISNVESDATIPLEDVFGTTAACQLDLCRGAKFEDNVDLVQSFTPGQVVRMQAIIPIPHEGPMNVSIVDTATNTVVGDPLIEFESYADESLAALPANNTNFSVTIPQLAAGQCTQAGDCVLQWFWFGTAAQQTYESCVDFVLE
ncbi:hypothetical protein JX265_000648 [Neoarthrinium moseri]|uniref:Chitin-binding type-4 domain-containing protein n=1 Tax=Neoarthrinium moseri TaxID=1658444 RepID=A0A9Q0AWG9_9PEZI|nr:uncharacterized protein JN550_001601 [Neoarthrinium moseri]KAI1854242.1 hypothetical protein JX266_001383 [Neoarthrinium moseri]KAI1876105.1 hypothetical protein JN550_001601 [Neoarthrinium moseri]KAI1881822.1 hypothetical protein JX265_000648 [Neoarthrinium moseri]